MTNKALSEEEIARRQLIKKRWLGAFVVADIILVALLAWEIVSIFIK